MPDTQANYRMLHTMIRVRDLDKSLAFYTGPMSMKLLRKRDVPDGKYSLAFVGYGDEPEHCVVELTHNWDQATPYELGTGFGHLAIGVPDVYKLCEDVTKAGGKVTPRGGAREVRDDRHCFRGRSRRLQDRADRTQGLSAAQPWERLDIASGNVRERRRKKDHTKLKPPRTHEQKRPALRALFVKPRCSRRSASLRRSGRAPCQ